MVSLVRQEVLEVKAGERGQGPDHKRLCICSMELGHLRNAMALEVSGHV